MTKLIYPQGLNAFLRGEIAFLTHDIRAVLVDLGAYTYSSAHQFLTDIPSGARVAISELLTGKTAVAGTADSDTIVFTAATGPTSEALVLYRDTGSAATSPLITFNDEVVASPVTPNGGDINYLVDTNLFTL